MLTRFVLPSATKMHGIRMYSKLFLQKPFARAERTVKQQKLFLGGAMRLQKRTLFIQYYETPNSSALKFVPGVEVLPTSSSMEFNSPLDAFKSPLAKTIFKVDGVKSIFLTQDFITVLIDEGKTDWSKAKPLVFDAINAHYQSNRPVIIEETKPSSDTQVEEEDDEVIVAIKEVIESRVRPLVQEDGGDVMFIKFEEGIVYLKLQGSCSSCSSSTVTLKIGIENMITHYVPEVVEVRQFKDDAELESEKHFDDTEKKIEQTQ